MLGATAEPDASAASAIARVPSIKELDRYSSTSAYTLSPDTGDIYGMLEALQDNRDDARLKSQG